VGEGKTRKIIHVDMDAFYASVEQRDQPALRGRPVIVGGQPSTRGVVAACSYEARAFGVRSAMPCAQAQRLCPTAIFVPPRMARYAEVSRQIRAVFLEITPLVEPLSLDEAYLDVTDNALNEPLAGKLARLIKDEIKRRTGLTASAGVGPNKLVAKIASDLRKPDGLTIVPPHEVADFLAPLPVTRLWGVGPRTNERLHDLGIKTVADVRRVDVALLSQRLGSYGPYLAELALGRDERPVDTRREAKSRGSETTFAHDVTSLTHLRTVLGELCDDVAADLARLSLRARTLTLKVRYDDFTTITRSRSVEPALRDAEHILEVAHALLMSSTEAGTRPVRLLGVSVSNLSSEHAPEQLWFRWDEHS
jgi:DNA polymerase-4